ncbi:Dimeric alpha-beta barrel [Penicillium nucicola]|uniref:Dimeric alpha-beta barrel n=1 Tax=Penicillium nucicola TaxID=1850975 RepID=UPI0025452F61|nr:Dimeric alpha-beta barrel [Penicillium nucicola]KAJ5753599.1 Dimeric alpha-beta barrel [Penicillium nucicola]
MPSNTMKPLPEDHQFTHSELNYDSEPNFHPAIKVSVFFKKKEGITHEQFYRHWQTVHADLAVATQAFQHNILRYAQHHQTPEMKALMTGIGESVLDYDACAQLWVKDWDGWLGFCQSSEYSAALGDDCARFMALPMKYMIGYENVVVGSAAQDLNGKSGLSTKAAQ